MSKAVFAALALAATALFASPASALESACLWNNLLEAKRAALLDDYRARGTKSLDNLQISDADVAAWPARCGVTEQNAETAGMLLGTEIIERGVAVNMKVDYRIETPALKSAWGGVTPAAKAKAKASVARTLDNQPADDGGSEALTAMRTTLKLPDAAMMDLALYVFALQAREIIEARK